MHTTTLRKVGGSLMLAVPPVFLEQLRLTAGNTAGVTTTDDGRLIIVPRPRPRPCYTIAELLAVSDYSQPVTEEEREWLDSPAVGKGLILFPIYKAIY